jgi:hexokinase
MTERKGTTGQTTMYKTLHRKHNDRKERYNRTNNDVQNITQKTKDRTTRTPQKTGDDISKIFPS